MCEMLFGEILCGDTALVTAGILLVMGHMFLSFIYWVFLLMH